VTILFERATWDTLHTWGGALMIAAVAIHFTFHWQWVKSMATRIARMVTGRSARLNRNGYVIWPWTPIVAVSFLLAAFSGIYFMFVTGNRWSPDPMILFSRLTWDLTITWSGVTMIVARSSTSPSIGAGRPR